MRTHIVGLLIVSWCLQGRYGYGQTDVAQTIIAMERAALDRWGNGDPQGFFEIMATDQTYFDPMTEKRLDAQSDLKQYIAPFAGKIKIERVEMIDPKVQTRGDIALLNFNLNDYGAQLGDGPKTTARWKFDRGLSAHQWLMEDHSFALVVCEAGSQRIKRGPQRRRSSDSSVRDPMGHGVGSQRS